MTTPTDTARQINAIRRSAGNPLRKCSTCGRPVAQPARNVSPDGVVLDGCVDASHVDHPDAWWLRPAAARIRASELTFLRSLGAA